MILIEYSYTMYESIIGGFILKKLMLGCMVICLLVILTACGGKSKEEVFSQAIKNIDEVKLYHIDLGLDVKLRAENYKTDSSAELTGLYNEETDDMDMKSIESTDDFSQENHFYRLNDIVYANSDDTGWVETTDLDGTFVIGNTSYRDIMEAIGSIEDIVEMESGKGTYDLTFQGKEVKVIDAFTKPFNLSFTGVNLETESTVDFVAHINKKTLLLEDVALIIDIDNPNGKMKLDANVVYKDINKVEIEIPQDVIDSAVTE